MMVISLLCSATAAVFLVPHLDHRGLMGKKKKGSEKSGGSSSSSSSSKDIEFGDIDSEYQIYKIVSLASMIDYIIDIRSLNQQKINEIGVTRENIKKKLTEIANENGSILSKVYTGLEKIYQEEEGKIKKEMEDLEEIQKHIKEAMPRLEDKEIEEEPSKNLKANLEKLTKLLDEDDKNGTTGKLGKKTYEVFEEYKWKIRAELNRKGLGDSEILTVLDSAQPTKEQIEKRSGIDNEQIYKKYILSEFSGTALGIVEEELFELQEKKYQKLLAEVSGQPNPPKQKDKKKKTAARPAPEKDEKVDIKNAALEPEKPKGASNSGAAKHSNPAGAAKHSNPAGGAESTTLVEEEKEIHAIIYYIVELVRDEVKEKWGLHGLWPEVNAGENELTNSDIEKIRVEEMELLLLKREIDVKLKKKIEDTYSSLEGWLPAWILFKHECLAHGIWMPLELRKPKDYAEKSIELFEEAEIECDGRLTSMRSRNVVVRRCRVCFDVNFVRFQCPY